MKIRRKTLLIIAVVGLAALLFTGLVSRSYILDHFETLERDGMRKNVERLVNAFNQELDVLDFIVRDWAEWDDSYRYMKDRNPEYEKATLNPETLENLDIRFIAYVDTSGHLVFGRSIDPATGALTPLTGEILEKLRLGEPLVTFSGESDGKKGVVLLKEGPVYAASRRILTSDQKGPSRGALVFGRALGRDTVNWLSKLIEAPVTLFGFNDRLLPGDVERARAAMLGGKAIEVIAPNREIVSGFTSVKDLYGRPALIFRVEAPRELTHRGLSIVTYLLLMFVVTSAFFGLVFVTLIEREVVAPVVRLSREISDIGGKHETRAKLPRGSVDELSSLASSVDEMLVSLDDADAGRRLALEELSVSDERYRTTLENVTDVIYTYAIDGTITFITPNVSRWGYEPQEIIGRKMLEFVHPEDREMVKKDMEITVATGQGFPTVCRLVTKSGGTVYIEESGSVIREEGRVTQLTGAIRDITERRRTEEELRNAHQKLEEVRRLSDIGTLAATVAHELRNPLSVIQTAAYNIRKKAGNPDVEKHIESIKKKVEESNQIINNLLFYSRIREAHAEELNVCAILNEVLEGAGNRFPRSRVAVEKGYVDCKGLGVHADPTQVKEVFNNIVNNAYQSIEDEEGRIRVWVAKNRMGYIDVGVEDSGSGIDEADLERIFDPFFTTKTRGTGLGLTITQEIVRLNNGEIRIESTKGVGTKVLVSLPSSADLRRT